MGRRSNGEGTLYKRKDGRWCAAYFDDMYKRKYVYGQTQAEVKRKLKEKQNLTALKPEKYTVQEWVLEFLEKYKKNEVKITTYNGYLQMYRKHILGSWIGKLKLSKLRATELQKFYNQKMKDGYNSKSVHHISVIVGSALEQAVRLRLIAENPNAFVTIPRKQKYEAKVLTAEDVNKLLSDAQEDELYPIVVTTLYTGMRKGEIMALQWNDVDFNNKRIYVNKSLCRVEEQEPDEKGRRRASYQLLEPKTGKSVRTIPMLDQVYDALILQKERQQQEKEKYKDVYCDQGFVFAEVDGTHIKQRGFMKKFHDFLNKYNVTNIRFHDLRHTFASLLIESDVSMKVVQEILGHSTITTSMDIYAHVSDAKKAQAVEVLQVKGGNRDE